MYEVPSSILGGYVQSFVLVEKNSKTVKKNSKSRENGIYRLRNGQMLHRWCLCSNLSLLAD